MTRKTLTLSLLLLICIATVAAANPDYEAAMERTAVLTADLQSYELHGTMLLKTEARGQDGGTGISIEVFAAARYPDRLASRQEGGFYNVNLGVGAEHSWFYLSRQNACFVGDPYPLSRDLDTEPGMALVPEKVFNFYSGLGQAILPDFLPVAAETGHEIFHLDGRDVPCQVFRTAEDVEAGLGPREYWYDPQSGLVLKAALCVYGDRGGMPMQQTMVYETVSISVNAPVDEKLFAYTPPEGVTVVNRLEKVVNPESLTGDPAPDVTFTDLDGNPVRLADFRGKVVFLDIWATWCGPCKMEMPHIEALHKELSPGGDVVFLAASSEPAETIKPFIKKAGYTFQVVRISQNDAVSLFNASNIPAGFVIDRNGMIRAHMVGVQSEQSLREALGRSGVGD